MEKSVHYMTMKRAVRKLENPLELAVLANIPNPTWVMYHPVPEIEIIEGRIPAQPTKEFYQVVVNHANAYLFDKTEPPAEIATAIKNIVDDHLSERTPVIRAGDYISLQNYIRKSKSQ
jgi:hypothetical protein